MTILTQYLSIVALVFLLSSILNVVLSTIKSILTIKGSTLQAATANAITFGFYTFIVKQIADVDLILSIPLTMIANFLGVYIAMFLVKKFSKDKVWRISCTVSPKRNLDSATFKDYFSKYNIEYNIIPLGTFANGYIVDIYSKNQTDSLIAKEIIKKYNIKYHIIECEKSL